MALLACVGVDEEGFREILAVEVAGTEKGAAYASMLRGLVDRGLSGVKLVVSDDHEGIKAAVFSELPGVDWQRCVVHFERNVLSHVPTTSMEEVANDLKAIFKVRREKSAREIHGKRFPRAVAVFEAGIDDALSYLSYPGSHHARIRTTNMLERLFEEVKRRTRVVGVFPNEVRGSTLATEIALRSSEQWALKRYLTMDALGEQGVEPHLRGHSVLYRRSNTLSIHPSAWMWNSANFALTAFYEVRIRRVLGSCPIPCDLSYLVCQPTWELTSSALYGQGR
jgi:transposase-like protein